RGMADLLDFARPTSRGKAMNSITRLLAIAGIGLAAAVSVAGPAQAAAQGDGHATHRTGVRATADWNDDQGDIVGYFASPIRCERVGRLGELRDRWDDYDCYRVRFGFHRGDWALEVSSDDNGWDDNGDDNG